MYFETILSYVNEVNIKNVTFTGLNNEQYELNQVNSFNK